MFKDVYKSANDDIIPDLELLDKILATEKPKKNHYTTLTRYGSVAAAFVILAGTLAIYPKIKDNLTKEEAVPKVVQSETVEYTTNEASTNYSDEVPTVSEDTNMVVIDKTAQKPTKEQPKKTAALPPDKVSPSPTTNDGEITVPDLNEEPGLESVTKETENSEEKENEASIQAAGVFTASIVPSAAFEESANDESAGYAMTRKAEVFVSEQEATFLADEVFLEDFGEEFLNSTKIKVECDEEFVITRYNEEISKTVIVFDDGEVQKQY